MISGGCPGDPDEFEWEDIVYTGRKEREQQRASGKGGAATGAGTGAGGGGATGTGTGTGGGTGGTGAGTGAGGTLGSTPGAGKGKTGASTTAGGGPPAGGGGMNPSLALAQAAAAKRSFHGHFVFQVSLKTHPLDLSYTLLFYRHHTAS